jgi:hypothetical protein
MRLLVLITLFTFSFASHAEYLLVEGRFTTHKKWMKFSDNERLNLKNLLQKLATSKTGRELIYQANQKAKADGLTLYDVIGAGHGSLTDTTLIRKFTTGSPEHVEYERRSKVFINKDLTQYDALLDLAHELTHFVYRKDFNPYELNFSLSQFIKNTIEGVGGEVQAFMMECKVHFELFPKVSSGRYSCQQILDAETGKLSFQKAVDRFYQVGNYYESFQNSLKQNGIKHHFPKVSSDKVSFVSSAYGIPYPVAAYEEYLTVINKVCENDRRRIGYFKNTEGRSPASLQKLESAYSSRCSHLSTF